MTANFKPHEKVPVSIPLARNTPSLFSQQGRGGPSFAAAKGGVTMIVSEWVPHLGKAPAKVSRLHFALRLTILPAMRHSSPFQEPSPIRPCRYRGREHQQAAD